MSKLVSTVVVRTVNGRAEGADEFVEVEGQKFVKGEDGKPKLGEDGKPVPFVEKKQETIDPAKADLVALAKVNPAVAKMLADTAEAKRIADEAAVTDETRKTEEAKKNGQWQQLAEENSKKLETANAKIVELQGQLAKYSQSVEEILTQVLATIPKEKHSLIPADYSNRQKLEYIMANAKMLGATVTNLGTKIDKSDVVPPGTEEEKLVTEIEELRKKPTRTASEDALMYDKAKLLKQLRAAKGNK